MGFERLDPRSRIHAEFTRLYRIARAMRPSARDGWNGELYARDDATWGSVNAHTGAISLNRDLVLPYLTGRNWPGREAEQTQALQTVLHEAYHQRVETDAPDEPNAYRGQASKALDEGLTEYGAKRGVRRLADLAGYGRLEPGRHAYPEAYLATVELLDHGASDDRGRDVLAHKALDRPVVMRWDTIAGHLVIERLASVMPDDPHHHRAARAELIRAMTHSAWDNLEASSAPAGQVAAHHTSSRLNTALLTLHSHYRNEPHQPYPGGPPNPSATPATGPVDQQRRSGPAAQASPETPAAAGKPPVDLLLGTAPAAGAVRRPTARTLNTRPRHNGPGHTHPGPNRPQERH